MGVFFVCFCSLSLSVGSFNGFVDNGVGFLFGVVFLSVYVFCEVVVKYLKV